MYTAHILSFQIPDGMHEFRVGKKRNNEADDIPGLINVTCRQNYFLSEGISCSPDQLENSKPLKLQVVCLKEALPTSRTIVLPPSPYVLDIDLDYFSTRNPFKDMFVEAGFYSKLHDIYVFESPQEKSTMEASLQASAARKRLICELEDLTEHLDQGGTLEAYSGPGNRHVAKMTELRDSIMACYGEDTDIDWQIVHNAGCTCDDTDLPHHVSTREEVTGMMSELKSHLQGWASYSSGQPLAVTVARSSLDDFCPPEQVEFIQEQTLEVLSSTLEKMAVHLLYKDQQ